MAAGTTKRGRDGFTLGEMVVAIAITAVIGLAVVGVTMAMSTAGEHARDRYLSLQTARITMLRLQRMIRKARLVTVASPTSIALWLEDSNGNGRINLAEVLFVEWSPNRKQIRMRRAVFPEDWPEETKAAMNTERELHPLTRVTGVMAMLSSSTVSSYQEITVLAGDVTDFKVNVWPVGPMTELVGLKMTVGSSPRAVTLRSAAHPRQAVTGLVGTADGKYVLMSPGAAQAY